jgi:hypothetical protein
MLLGTTTWVKTESRREWLYEGGRDKRVHEEEGMKNRRKIGENENGNRRRRRRKGEKDIEQK